VKLMAEPNDPAPGLWLEELRQQRKGLKVALKLAGCSPDDVDSGLAGGVDLVLNSDSSEADILRKLESLLG
jgi:hypothetical protein